MSRKRKFGGGSSGGSTTTVSQNLSPQQEQLLAEQSQIINQQIQQWQSMAPLFNLITGQEQSLGNIASFAEGNPNLKISNLLNVISDPTIPDVIKNQAYDQINTHFQDAIQQAVSAMTVGGIPPNEGVGAATNLSLEEARGEALGGADVQFATEEATRRQQTAGTTLAQLLGLLSGAGAWSQAFSPLGSQAVSGLAGLSGQYQNAVQNALAAQAAQAQQSGQLWNALGGLAGTAAGYFTQPQQPYWGTPPFLPGGYAGGGGIGNPLAYAGQLVGGGIGTPATTTQTTSGGSGGFNWLNLLGPLGSLIGAL